MSVAAGLVFVLFNVLLLPYVAHHLQRRWWAFLIWGVLAGALLAIPAGLFTVVAGATAAHILWIVIDVGLILMVCLRLALARK